MTEVNIWNKFVDAIRININNIKFSKINEIIIRNDNIAISKRKKG